MSTLVPLKIDGHDAIFEIIPQRFGDSRGYFSEIYNRNTLAELGFDLDFVQDNQSISFAKGTVRGLHFQTPPFAQAKLIRVLRGSVFDVAVDIRQGSPTYGRHVSAIVSAGRFNQVLVPAGFAHGFCTLEPDTEVFYKASAFYSNEHEKGILWCDPDLNIAWPVGVDAAVLSEKDTRLPRLRDLAPAFTCERDEK